MKAKYKQLAKLLSGIVKDVVSAQTKCPEAFLELKRMDNDRPV